MSSAQGPRSRAARALLLAGGCLCVGLGLLGIVLPVLPTTPFLLLAAFLFARSSDRLLEWMLRQRWLGGYISAYREKRGMPLREKVITLTSLWLAMGLTCAFVLEAWWARLLLGGIAVGVTAHILRLRTRPPGEPSQAAYRASDQEPET